MLLRIKYVQKKLRMYVYTGNYWNKKMFVYFLAISQQRVEKRKIMEKLLIVFNLLVKIQNYLIIITIAGFLKFKYFRTRPGFNEYFFFIRTRKIDLRLILTFQWEPSLEMFLFFSNLKSAIFASPTVYPIWYLRCLFRKVFSFLHLLIICATCKKVSHYRIYCATWWMKIFYVFFLKTCFLNACRTWVLVDYTRNWSKLLV